MFVFYLRLPHIHIDAHAKLPTFLDVLNCRIMIKNNINKYYKQV